MSDAIVTTAGAPTRVAQVESQLTNLWSQAVQGDAALLRATTLNLIIYSDSLDAAMKAAAQVPDRHPCRTILIVLSENADEPLTATPAILCRPSFGREMRAQVCGEQITLSVGRNQLDRVPGAIQSLILTDEPTFLLWQGYPSSADPIFKGICDVLNGVIIDSATTENVEEGFRSVLALLSAPSFIGHLYDLNWRRLIPWCQAISQQFDPPSDRTALKTINSVEITQHNARGRAILLIGWLADRLRWKLSPGKQPDEWVGRSASGIVSLRFKEGGDSAQGIERVVIGTQSRTYTIENMSADNVLIVQMAGQNVVKAKAPLDAGALLNMTLDSTGPDRLYEQALRQAVTLGSGLDNLHERSGLIVAEDADALKRLAAREFVQIARMSLKWHKRFAVALSGGSTPKALFELLAQAPYRDQIPWAQTHLFWGDERDVPIDHPDSNQRMAREALIDHVPIPPANVHGLLTGQLSASDAASRYAAELRAFFEVSNDELPQFDLILLGLGDDGHTASLFPHTGALKAKETDLFVSNVVPQLNTTRLTLTADVINHAANVIFLVAGSKKADILYEVIRGPYKPDDHPSQRIRPVDGLLTFMVDQAAAARLRADAK